MSTENTFETELFIKLRKAVVDKIEKYVETRFSLEERNSEYPSYYPVIVEVGQFLVDKYENFPENYREIVMVGQYLIDTYEDVR